MQNSTTSLSSNLSQNSGTLMEGFVKWSQISDANEADRFSTSDTKCLQELRAVLKKYKQLDRLGITLLHKHFKIEDDEVLLETTNTKERSQSVRPVKIKDLELEGMPIIAASVKLVEGEPVSVAVGLCRVDPKDNKHYDVG